MSSTDKLKSKSQAGDEAIKKSTGKNWKEWFAILDKAGAKKMTHKEIVAFIGKHYGKKVSGWWQQMITVTYKQTRGLHEKHEKPGGYQISVSKVLSVPLKDLFAYWNDAKLRRRWLTEDDIIVRKSTLKKSMRMTWVDKRTSLNVNFYAKGKSKSQVVVQHVKLADLKEADKRKAYWKQMLERLNSVLNFSVP